MADCQTVSCLAYDYFQSLEKLFDANIFYLVITKLQAITIEMIDHANEIFGVGSSKLARS